MYRVFCNNHGLYFGNVVSEVEPTSCPSVPATHVIDQSLTVELTPQHGDVDDISADVYGDIHSSGSSTFEGTVSFAGATVIGLTAESNLEILKLTNISTSNMNSYSYGTTFYGIDYVTPLINSDPSLFSLNSSTITVNESGTYEVMIHMYFTSYSSRVNAGIQILINDGPIGRIGASAYTSNRSGHNESSTALSEVFTLTAGDTIKIRGSRMAGYGTVSTPSNTSSIQVKRLK